MHPVIIALIVLAVAVLVLVVAIHLRPNEFRISRSATMAAPPARVFEQVNDFHLWEAWSPWAKRDPAARQSFEGPSSGTGAAFGWDGNSEVGAGKMTVTESVPNERIRIRLEFLRPFKATNAAEFDFKPEGNQTAVTWSMSGQHTFLFKAMGLIMNMDKMVGGDFEKGLASMKAIVEAKQ